MIIKWGIVGLGNMANIFARSIGEVQNAKLVCVASKSKNKLEIFAKNFNIKSFHKFTDYSELIKSNEIDAVYIATLNNTHVDLILECIENNKKILCEKPIGMNVKQAKIVFEAIKKNKTSFYEAIAYRSHPQTDILLQLIQREEIGEIKKINSTFGFKIKRVKKDSRLFSKELGGGAILDVGCYPVSFFNLLKKENENIRLIKSKGTFSITGVDDETEADFIIGKNILANCKVSFKENLKNSCTIYGSKGTINVPSPWLPSVKSYIEIFNDNSYYKNFISSKKNIYAIQIEHISNLFLNDEKKKTFQVNIDESIEIINILDKWKLSII
tara:strand:- start:226 stop:1209 length:984 start_codon:yes stop_codon:yes gene_type:complete